MQNKRLTIKPNFLKRSNLRPETLRKIRHLYSCFPVNFENFSKHLFDRAGYTSFEP